MQKTFHIDDIYNGLVVLENGFDSSDTIITSQYETQEWKNFCKHMYEWNQEGLLLPDASTSTDNAPMKTVGFADFENLNPTKISDCENTWGHEFVYAQFVEPLKDTEIREDGASLLVVKIRKKQWSFGILCIQIKMLPHYVLMVLKA